MPSQANKAFITVCEKTYHNKSIASGIVWHAKKTKGFAVTSSSINSGQGEKNYMGKSKNPTPALCLTLMCGAL